MEKRNPAHYPCKSMQSFGPIVLSISEYLFPLFFLYLSFECFSLNKTPVLSGFVFNVNFVNVELMKYVCNLKTLSRVQTYTVFDIILVLSVYQLFISAK